MHLIMIIERLCLPLFASLIIYFKCYLKSIICILSLYYLKLIVYCLLSSILSEIQTEFLVKTVLFLLIMALIKDVIVLICKSVFIVVNLPLMIGEIKGKISVQNIYGNKETFEALCDNWFYVMTKSGLIISSILLF